MAMKLVPIIKEPEVPSYTQGVIDGVGAVFGLGALVVYYLEGCDGKGMSRLLIEAIGPGRNLDGHIIKTPI